MAWLAEAQALLTEKQGPVMPWAMATALAAQLAMARTTVLGWGLRSSM